MVDSIVDNHSLRTARKVIITLHVSTLTTAQQVTTIKSQLLQYLQKQHDINSINIYFSEITKGALILQIDYILTTLDFASFAKNKDESNSTILQILQTNNVALCNL